MTETSPFFINGEFIDAAGRDVIDNINPASGEQVGKVPLATSSDVDHAVNAARSAQQGDWARMDPSKRGDVLDRVASGIERRFDDFVRAEITDTGKPYSQASTIDIPRSAANFRIFADLARVVADESFRTSTPDGAGALNYTVRKPKGVVAVICPWNLPLLLLTWKVAPALACGNSVVVKPSEETPSTATLLAEVMSEAGVPAGIYNVVHGLGPNCAGQHLVSHPGVDAVTFTGETITGAAIMRTAADGIKDVSFELGGKNPGIVFADCDLDKAIEGTLRSAFANCGQVCLGTERLYVERPVFDQFLSRLTQGAESLVSGDPYATETNLGPLISRQHREKVLSYYQQAERSGARILTGGGVPALGRELDQGNWIQPTIWTGLAEDSVVCRDEIFGPCCHVQPFDEPEEAVAMANDTDYGLAATVWTRDLSKASNISTRINSGICWVNCWFLRDLRTPFGGTGKSGIGREGGHYSLDFYTELQNVCIKL